MQSRIKTLQVYHTDFDVKKFVDSLPAKSLSKTH